MHGFGHMLGIHTIAAIQVRYRAGDAKDFP